jgi:hypothetical protein
MIRKISTSLAALAAMGIAGAASAATLTVLKGEGTKIIDAPPANGGVFMLPESAEMNATNLNEPGADIPVVQLQTNFPIGAVEMDFPRRNGFNRGCSTTNPGATYFGEAVLAGGSNTVPEEVLGVWPQIARVANPAGDLVGRQLHQCGDTALTYSNGAPYGNGIHEFALGVSARWDNTLQSSSYLFAPPGVYEIELSLTIVP